MRNLRVQGMYHPSMNVANVNQVGKEVIIIIARIVAHVRIVLGRARVE